MENETESSRESKYDLTPREKFNAYTGAIGGAVAPVIGMRDLMFPNISGSIGGELLSWAATGITTAAGVYCFPNFYLGCFATGAGLGVISVLQLRESLKKSNLEAKLQEERK